MDHSKDLECVQNIEMCRICLLRDCKTISIFNCEDSVRISDKIMSCTNIIIVETDDFPGVICENCLNELDVAVKFKRKSENSDRILKEYYSTNPVTYEVKNEQTLVNNEPEIQNSKLENDEKNGGVISKDLLSTDTKENDIKYELETFEHNLDTDLCEDFQSDVQIHVSSTKSKPKKKHLKRKRKKGDDLKCPTCNLVCQSRWILTVHKRTHSGERPYQCEVCHKGFVSNSNMKMHQQLQHNEEKQVCSECGKSFSCLTYLKRHLVRHLSVKPFGCSLCERRFTTKAYLKEHLARHRGDKKFFCEVCGDKFISTVNLKQHMLVHGLQQREYKRHECTFCDYRTTGRVDLARHMRKHTGEKPFRCPWDGCSSAFAGKPSLNLHIRIHTGEKPYVCSECPAAFSRGDKFKSHMIKRHNTSDVGPSKRSKLALQTQDTITTKT